LCAELSFRAFVAPAVLVAQSEEAGIAEIKPQDVNRLLDVHAVTQGRRSASRRGDRHERPTLSRGPVGQRRGRRLVVRRGGEQHAHNVAELLPHIATCSRDRSKDCGTIVQVDAVERGRNDGRSGPNVHQSVQEPLLAAGDRIDSRAADAPRASLRRIPLAESGPSRACFPACRPGFSERLLSLNHNYYQCVNVIYKQTLHYPPAHRGVTQVTPKPEFL
jgi:hypothetical protein